MDTTWLSTAIVVLLASALQATTGFGFAVISIPLLILFRDPHSAVIINTMLACFTSTISAFRLWQKADLRVIRTLIFGAITGFPIGTYVVQFFDVQFFKLFISITILLFIVLLCAKRKLISIDQSGTFITGWISGFLTGTVGIPGPPIVLFLAAQESKKDVFRSTTLVYFSFVYTVALTSFFLFEQFSPDLLIEGFTLIPVVFCGMLLGTYIFERVSQKMFSQLTIFILIFAALYSLFSGLKQ